MNEGGLDFFGKVDGPELGAVVRNEFGWLAVDEKQPFEFLLHRKRGEAGSRFEQQAFPSEAVQNRKDPRLATAFQPVAGEVHAPGLVPPREFQRRTLCHLQALARLAGEPQALGFPDSVDRLEVHAGQQRMDAPKAISRVRPGKLENLLPKFRVSLLRLRPTRHPGKPRVSAGAAPRETDLQQMPNHLTPGSQAHHFPEAISF